MPSFDLSQADIELFRRERKKNPSDTDLLCLIANKIQEFTGTKQQFVVYLHDITNTTPWSSGDAFNFTMMEHIAGNIRQDHLALVLNKCNDVLNDATNDNIRNLWSNPARAGPYVNGNVRDLPAKIIDNLLEIKGLSSLKFLEELREDGPLHLTSAGQHVVQKLTTQINLLQKRYEMAKAIRKADEKANHKWWSKESAQEKDLLDEIEKLTSEKKRFMKME